ncbi:MAG: hypothetical protein AB7I38_14505 [Dehalococcoidia bacterium]
MSKATTAAIAAGALVVGGIAGATLAPVSSTPAPALADLQAKARALADGLDAYAAALPTPTASPSPSDIPTVLPSPSATDVSPTISPTPNSSSTAPTSSSPTPSGSIGTLAWKPPALTNPTTITPTDEQGKITLSAGKDYIIKLPTDRPWRNSRGLWVEGGRNVVIIGGQVDVGDGYFNGGTGPGVQANGYVRRAAYFLSQTGTVHLEGVRFTASSGALSEGINISAALAKVQIQNVAISTPLVGTKAANHADALQSWNGPTTLLVDGFTATTGYQGMFLNPHDTSSASVVTEGWQLRNVEIIGTAAAKYILWRVKPPQSIATVNVYTSGGLGNWNGATDWPGVKHGVRAPAPFATTAGPGYVSPGYGP